MTHSLMLEHRLGKSVHQVYDCLVDPQKFVRFHPVIYRMDPIGQSTYLVHEKLSLIGLPINFTYKAKISAFPSQNKVEMSASVFGLVNLEIQFIIAAQQEGCIVSECIQIQSILPLAWAMKPVFKKQHALLFEAIRTQA